MLEKGVTVFLEPTANRYVTSIRLVQLRNQIDFPSALAVASAQGLLCSSSGICTKVEDPNRSDGTTVTITETVAGQAYAYTAVVVKESTRTLTVIAPGAVRTPIKNAAVSLSRTSSRTSSSTRPSATRSSSAAEHRTVVASAFGGGVLAFALYLLV